MGEDEFPHMQTKKRSKQLRRDWIDVIRTAIWYAYIESNFSHATSYQIEKIIEPEAFVKDKNYFYHHNKWAKYKLGKHTPEIELIDKANQHVKGTAKILNHVLWEAIRGHKPMKWFMDNGVNQLSWDVQRIIFKSVNGQMELISVSKIRKELRRIERLSSFDALAALTIYLRVADDQNQREIALSIGQSIYRILLVICVFSPLAHFSYGLAFLIYLYVFPLCQSEMRQYNSKDIDDFSDKCQNLNYALLVAEDRNIIDVERKGISKKMYTDFLFDIQDGKRGFEVKRLFLPTF